MRRSLTLLLLTTPIWAQFQSAPAQQPYPQDMPNVGYQAQSQYPTQQPYPAPGQYPTSPQQPYPAQGQQPYPQDDQQPAAEDQQHGVARLRIVQGDVNIKRGDNGILTGAIMNAPLLSHDHLETGPGSRAEIELDNTSVIRLAPDTDLGVANLVFGNAQVQLGIGTAIVRIGGNPQTQVELDTPSVSFHPLGPGEYRVSVFDNGTTQVIVRSGRLEMSGPRGSQTIEQGQSLVVRGDANDPEFQQAYEAPRDQFDEWSNSRDAEMMPARSAQYVNADIYGSQDLDRYGTWGPSEYGQVWTPQGVGPDWSPYSNGQWSYADYYGWTWIGYEPWGWAPYHYGRWFHGSVGWCWWPGERFGFGARWSPGLVSFFGFGGGLGWVSLAPHEYYHPWWGRGGYGGYGAFRGGYDIHGYRNAGFRGGAITAGFNGFAGAGHRYSFADAGQLRSASMYRGGIPVSPGASSYRFSERSVNSNQRFSQASSRTFFSRPSASFNNSRYGSSGGSYNGSRYSTPSAGSNNGGGWQRFGSAAPQRQQQQPQTFSSRPSSGGESGWHNFGQPQQQQTAPRYNAPANTNRGGNGYGGSYRAPAAAPSYNYNRAPSAPSYNRAPSAPSYNRAPSAPSYNYRSPAPRSSAPSYSAPRSNGGGGGSRPSSGGGGGHSSGGGGHHR